MHRLNRVITNTAQQREAYFRLKDQLLQVSLRFPLTVKDEVDESDFLHSDVVVNITGQIS